MAENTAIEYWDASFNAWTGSTKELVLGNVLGWPGGVRVRAKPGAWGGELLRWNARRFLACGRRHCGWRGNEREAVNARQLCPRCLRPTLQAARRRVICGGLAKLFDNEVDRYHRESVGELILHTPNLDWLLLTKKIGNDGRLLGEMFPDGPPDNVWLGATVINQEEADRDIPKLLDTPAAVRFLSIEPMLGPVNLNRIHESGTMGGGGSWDSWESCLTGRRFDVSCDGETDGWPKVDWIIAGGESGPKARPMHPDWVRSLRDQCAAAGVPFMFKQWGEWLPLSHQTGGADPEQRQCHVWPDGRPYDGSNEVMTPACNQLSRVGKKAAGRLLDGIEHNGFPGGST